MTVINKHWLEPDDQSRPMPELPPGWKFYTGANYRPLGDDDWIHVSNSYRDDTNHIVTVRQWLNLGWIVVVQTPFKDHASAEILSRRIMEILNFDNFKKITG